MALLACPLAPRIDVGAQTWSEVRGSVFTLRSDAEPGTVAELARDLELFVAVVREVADVAIESPQQPIHVYAIVNPELMRGIGIGRGTRIGGLHSPTAHGSVVLTDVSGYRDSARTILYHEFVHFLLARSGAYVPLWYHEGLADFLSSVRERDDLVTVGHPAPWRAAVLEGADRLPVVDLLSAHGYPREGAEVASFYATSWLFVHYLHTGVANDGTRLRSRAVDYLLQLARGEPWADAFDVAFGTTPEAFDAALEAHLEAVQAGHLRLVHLHAPDLDRAESEPIAIASPTAVAADLAEVLLSYHRGAATDTAMDILETSLAADPDEPSARAALAWAKARRFRPPAGEAELAQALALGDASPRVHLQAGRFYLVRAERARDGRERELARAREHFLRAAALDAGLAAAWTELGGSYSLDGIDEPPGPGIEALERARALLPADTAVHLSLGKLRARAGELDLAREHLELVLRWSWSDEQREEALEALAGIGE